MTESSIHPLPKSYCDIELATKAIGFTMASDMFTRSLLRTLAASKPKGKLLELGTGTGLSTSWILDGMDGLSMLTSIENEEGFLGIAKKYIGCDERLNLVCTDAGTWIKDHSGFKFDLVFADTWHGKYLLLDEVLEMVSVGGIYIVDDMLPQPNWPEGHAEKVFDFVKRLEARKDFTLTEQNWSTGIIIAVKRF